MSCRGFEICVSTMDAESCWSDAFCSSLPQDKSFNKNTFIFTQEKEDDAFIFISDLLHVPDDCDFSDASLRFYDESTPNSSQTDLDNFLASLLTESETHNTFTVPVPETKNSLNGDPGKMGSTFLYSGPIHTEVQTTRPTLINVQSVLSMYDRKEQASPAFMPTTSISNTPSIFESLRSAKLPPFLNSLNELSYRRLRRPRSEGKYVVKVKYPGIGIDDGYKWRKYGQKAIKNSPYPRSYYRCTYPKCKAKKQLERCIENPDTLSITYEGLHPHYSYPSFQISEQLNYSLRQQNNNIYEKGENKKAVIDNVFNGCFNNEGGDVMQSSESPTIVAAHQQLQEEQDKCYESLRVGTENSDIMDIVVEEEGGEWRRDGLLQDIVPFQVINPLSSSSFPFSSSSSSP